MGKALIDVPDVTVVELVRQMSVHSKRAVLQELIVDLDDWDGMMAVGEARLRAICTERGMDWAALDDSAREHLVDDLLHEGPA